MKISGQKESIKPYLEWVPKMDRDLLRSPDAEEVMKGFLIMCQLFHHTKVGSLQFLNQTSEI